MDRGCPATDFATGRTVPTASRPNARRPARGSRYDRNGMRSARSPVTGALTLSLLLALAGCGGGGGNDGAAAAPVTPAVPANQPPQLTSARFEVDEDQSLTAQLTATDAEGQSISFTRATDPAQGTLTLASSGALTYVPPWRTSTATPASTSRSPTPGGAQRTATVTIAVRPVNDAPVARDDQLRVATGAPVTLSLLANDTDLDGDALDVTILTQGRGGTVSVGAGNVVTLTPGRQLLRAPGVHVSRDRRRRDHRRRHGAAAGGPVRRHRLRRRRNHARDARTPPLRRRAHGEVECAARAGLHARQHRDLGRRATRRLRLARPDLRSHLRRRPREPWRGARGLHDRRQVAGLHEHSGPAPQRQRLTPAGARSGTPARLELGRRRHGGRRRRAPRGHRQQRDRAAARRAVRRGRWRRTVGAGAGGRPAAADVGDWLYDGVSRQQRRARDAAAGRRGTMRRTRARARVPMRSSLATARDCCTSRSSSSRTPTSSGTCW